MGGFPPRRLRMGMYDKLGDLLSAALESGGIPKKGTGGARGGAREETAKKPARALSREESDALRALGLGEGADMAAIKKAFRARVKMFHPDSNAPNETVQRAAWRKTREVVAAYETLKKSFGSSL